MQSTFVALLLCALLRGTAGYGEPFTTPVQAVETDQRFYLERSYFTTMNLVRVDPTRYKSIYMNGFQFYSGSSYVTPDLTRILTAAIFPAVNPLYMEPRLFASAYNHSLDMTNNNCFQHNTCGSTEAFNIRIGHFYTGCSGSEGENIAAGYETALSTNNGYLCDDGECASDPSNQCGSEAPNNSTCDGHRANIMSSSYGSAGVGYSYNSATSYDYYWTTDFGGACTGQTSPIYSATHFIAGTTIKFVAVFYNSTAPSAAQVIISGTQYNLASELGTTSRGSYILNTTTGNACRFYYFTFTVGSKTYRYPDTGCLATYGEGSCTSSFSTTCALAPTNSPTPAPTVKAPTASPAPTNAATPKPGSTNPPTTPATPAPCPGTCIYNGGLVSPWSSYEYTQYSSVTYQSVAAAYEANLMTYSNSVSPNEYAYFVWFDRSTSITNTFTNVGFNIVGSASGSVRIYFNGGYVLATVPVTTTWTTHTVNIKYTGTAPDGPQTIGGGANQLVFANPSTTETFYIYLQNIYLQ